MNAHVISIDHKITSVRLGEKVTPPKVVAENLHEKLKRPRVLEGRSYQLKTPLASSSVYITINNITLNAGTPHEVVRPFEIFISAKEMENFQWIIALTLLISAIFRKGGDVTFIIDQLKSVFDPRGGYLSKSGHVPSLVAEIGGVIEEHFKAIGLIEEDTSLSDAIAEKKERHISNGGAIKGSECPKCKSHTLVPLDGCPTCLTCSYSKCG